ncbi:hypothetical protein [Comamonas sp. JUb58]|uniref:hypothetical protein n=1 Tax=Comamonas sp. JUb58 TaxID=2485114 RepID=UPI00105F2DFD|nr:hypothetical protein [Comamonas sp. JUb58]
MNEILDFLNAYAFLILALIFSGVFTAIVWRIEKTFNTIFSNAEIQARLREAEQLKGVKK